MTLDRILSPTLDVPRYSFFSGSAVAGLRTANHIIETRLAISVFVFTLTNRSGEFTGSFPFRTPLECIFYFHGRKFATKAVSLICKEPPSRDIVTISLHCVCIRTLHETTANSRLR